MAGAQTYSGAESCRPCHAKQYLDQSKSGHARALARENDPQKGHWAFGSGTHAITWVSRKDETHYTEQGLSWFRLTNKLALTPGHATDQGVGYRLYDPGAQIFRCFSCHSTGPLNVTPERGIQPQEPGVRCEVCHGPGQTHVQAKGGRFNIENPKRFQASAINEQCGACHRQSQSGAAAADWRDPWNVRHQPVYLAESRCFLRSEGKLTCLTCHDPHAPLNTNSSHYTPICSNCHAKPAHSSQHAGACVNCHMPKVAPSKDIAFSNHWIGVFRPNSPLRPRR